MTDRAQTLRALAISTFSFLVTVPSLIAAYYWLT